MGSEGIVCRIDSTRAATGLQSRGAAENIGEHRQTIVQSFESGHAEHVLKWLLRYIRTHMLQQAAYSIVARTSNADDTVRPSALTADPYRRAKLFCRPLCNTRKIRE